MKKLLCIAFLATFQLYAQAQEKKSSPSVTTDKTGIQKEEVIVSPKSFTDTFSLVLNLNKAEEISLVIQDKDKKVVHERKVENVKSSFKISLGGQPNGTYTLYLLDKNKKIIYQSELTKTGEN